MTTREEFEAWADSKSITGGNRRIARLTWMVCRDLTLEEAAKECDLMAKSYDASFELERADASEQCALGIRALK